MILGSWRPFQMRFVRGGEVSMEKFFLQLLPFTLIWFKHSRGYAEDHFSCIRPQSELHVPLLPANGWQRFIHPIGGFRFISPNNTHMCNCKSWTGSQFDTFAILCQAAGGGSFLVSSRFRKFSLNSLLLAPSRWPFTLTASCPPYADRQRPRKSKTCRTAVRFSYGWAGARPEVGLQRPYVSSDSQLDI